MTDRVTAVERAFEMARSGRFRTFSEIRRELGAEGYWDARAHLEGRFIKTQLAAAMTGEAPGQPICPRAMPAAVEAKVRRRRS